MEISVNLDILRCCREQVGLTIESAQQKSALRTLPKIEEGKHLPTFKQLEKLSKVYLVPSWVFAKEALPDEYDFSKTIPEFRRFKITSKVEDTYKLKRLVRKLEEFRKIIIYLREEMKEPIPQISLSENQLTRSNIIDFARQMRE